LITCGDLSLVFSGACVGCPPGGCLMWREKPSGASLGALFKGVVSPSAVQEPSESFSAENGYPHRWKTPLDSRSWWEIRGRFRVELPK